MDTGLNRSNESQSRTSNKTMGKETFIFCLIANPERCIHIYKPEASGKHFFQMWGKPTIEEIRA